MHRACLRILIVLTSTCAASAAVDWISLYPTLHLHNSTSCEHPDVKDEESLLSILVDGDEPGLDTMAALQLQSGLTVAYRLEEFQAMIVDERGTTREVLSSRFTERFLAPACHV
jgi:hypothetical protein